MALRRVYFILGCTAAGKGALGCQLARRVGGRIVSVDSMKVYRRMDIGTGKPSAEIRREIPHYCIDIVEPWEGFSVATYLAHADRAIGDCRTAGAIRLAVGGASLYIKALSEGLFDAPAADPEFRRMLQARVRQEGPAALHAELAGVDGDAAARIHPNDAKRILRALEVYHATGKPISELQRQWDAGSRRYDCVFIGLRRSKEDLHGRINRRVKRMIADGLKDEVASLLAEPKSLAAQAAQAVGYAEMIDHLQGKCTLEEATERIKINTRRLAKKQRSWHRRFRDARWFDVAADEPAEKLAERVLAEVTFE